MACCDRGYDRPSGRPRVSNPATYCSSTPRVQPPAVARWYSPLHGLATAIHGISGLVKFWSRGSTPTYSVSSQNSSGNNKMACTGIANFSVHSINLKGKELAGEIWCPISHDANPSDLGKICQSFKHFTNTVLFEGAHSFVYSGPADFFHVSPILNQFFDL